MTLRRPSTSARRSSPEPYGGKRQGMEIASMYLPPDDFEMGMAT